MITLWYNYIAILYKYYNCVFLIFLSNCRESFSSWSPPYKQNNTQNPLNKYPKKKYFSNFNSFYFVFIQNSNTKLYLVYIFWFFSFINFLFYKSLSFSIRHLDRSTLFLILIPITPTPQVLRTISGSNRSLIDNILRYGFHIVGPANFGTGIDE